MSGTAQPAARRFLVTGAERGIGEALCLALKARGDWVFGACMGNAPELRAAGVEVATGIDVTSDEAVAALARRLAGQRLDAIVHNAGVCHQGQLGGFRARDFLHEYDVNALGPLRVTQALLPLLGAGSKIALITSRVGSLGDNQSGGLYGYRMSKAAANMLGLCLARDLVGRGIAVVCLHPGTVRTSMTQALTGMALGDAVEPAQAAAGLLARIDELTLETTGTFRHANGQTLPW